MLQLPIALRFAIILGSTMGCGAASTAPAPEQTGWITRPVAAPGVQYRQFGSVSARTTVSYHVYIPPQYDSRPDSRFPVLYWLHGTGGGLPGIAPLAAFFDGAVRAGRMPPVLIVFANGMASSMWADSRDGRVPMETVVARDLVDEVDTHFRTLATRDGRVLEGFSMGGYGAARLGLRYSERFGAVSVLAGGPFDLDFAGPRARANPAERDRIFRDVFGNDLQYYRELSPLSVGETFAASGAPAPRLRIVVGAADDTRAGNVALHERYTALGITHDFEDLPGVGHDTMQLLTALGDRLWEFYRTP